MEYLQILEKFCVKETSIDSGNTDNPHKRNSRIQIQDPNLTSNQELKKERVGKKSPTTQQINQLQWDGQRSTLILYIPKWHDLLKGSKSKKALKVLQHLVPPTYRDIIQNSSSLEECLMELATYCTPEDAHNQATRNDTRKRKSSERSGSRRPVAKEESTPVKKKLKLPCSVCAETNNSNLLGCPKFKRYLPSQSSKTRSLPKDVCKLCLGTIYRDCRHNGMKRYQDYMCQTSKRNFIICSTCSKHERAHHWLRVNHDPSVGKDNMCQTSKRNFIICSTCSKHENAQQWLRVNHDPSIGNDNIIFMHRAIGYENLQVNAISIIADTRNQENPKSLRVESGSRKDGHKPSRNLQERQETLTAGGPQIPRASLPYEVIHIKVKDKQIPAVITYNTGAEFLICNKDALLMANSIEKTRRN